MDMPEKDWGKGIPEYTEEDLLRGLDLQGFCTDIIAQRMEKQGFTIEGICVDSVPTQVVAHRDGKAYRVITAGAIRPRIPRIPFGMKRGFAAFCISNGEVPMFMGVQMTSVDPERSLAGLGLKYDDMTADFAEPEDLTEVPDPEPGTEAYRAWCAERIVDAYEAGTFKPLYDLFADDIEFTSMWVMETLHGKDAVRNYYDGKGKTLREGRTKIGGGVVITRKPLNWAENAVLLKKGTGSEKKSRFALYTKPGTIGALMRQDINGQRNWMFVIPEFDENNKIRELKLNDPRLFDFEDYYTF